MDASDTLPHGALDGVKVLDLSRILAGPTCTQLLGDLGATVIKVENPKSGGDDTRQWGPPYAVDADGNPTDLSAYYMAANRNKRSVAVDITTSEGQAEIRRLAAEADILIENFKPGGLAKYGLDYASLKDEFPGWSIARSRATGRPAPTTTARDMILWHRGLAASCHSPAIPRGSP